MPSLWNWLTKPKAETEKTRNRVKLSKDQKKRLEGAPKRHFGSSPDDRQIKYSRDAARNQERDFYMGEGAAFSHSSPRDNERTRQLEKEQYFRDLQEFVAENQSPRDPPRRPLAFEIFSNTTTTTTTTPPVRSSSRERAEYLSHPPFKESFSSQAELRYHYQHYQPSPGRISIASSEGVNPGFFGGGPSSRNPRHRVQQQGYQDRASREEAVRRRAESMYVYTPKVTSQQDASALLFGRDKEHILPSPQANTGMHHFAKRPDLDSSIYEDSLEENTFDSLPAFSTSRETSIFSGSDFGKNNHHFTKGYNNDTTAMDRSTHNAAAKNYSANYTRQWSKNNNFYFTGSALLPGTDSHSNSSGNHGSAIPHPSHMQPSATKGATNYDKEHMLRTRHEPAGANRSPVYNGTSKNYNSGGDRQESELPFLSSNLKWPGAQSGEDDDAWKQYETMFNSQGEVLY